jgi:hypothetical protein
VLLAPFSAASPLKRSRKTPAGHPAFLAAFFPSFFLYPAFFPWRRSRLSP